VILVDNASKPPNPIYEGVKQIRLERDRNYSLARAINVGIKAAGNRDWYILLHGDMKLTRSFIKEIEKLDTHKYYNGEIRPVIEDDRPWEYGVGRPSVISKQLLSAIGYFDENFKLYSCEDVDYSWRAVKEGFELSIIDTGIIHADYRDEERKNIYRVNRKRILANETYLRKKHGY
jgi:GT2 family glycosyltransferase